MRALLFLFNLSVVASAHSDVEKHGFIFSQKP